MKRKISVILLIACIFTGTVFAQNSDVSNKKLGRNTTFVRNGFWDNWFIGFGGGASFYLNDMGKNASGEYVNFKNRITPMPQLQIGKWYNPYFGGRFRFTGGQLNSFDGSVAKKLIFDYVSGDFDFMWNVSNYLGHNSSTRVYSFIPYIGLGYIYGWNYRMNKQRYGAAHESSATMNGGIINRFRLCRRVNLDIDISGQWFHENMDQMGHKEYNGIADVSANLVINLGSKTSFSPVKDCNIELDNLNTKVNAYHVALTTLQTENQQLKAQNGELSKNESAQGLTIDSLKNQITKLNSEPKTVSSVLVMKSVSPATVVIPFKIGQMQPDESTKSLITGIAEFLNKNRTAKVFITGYTDKSGSNELNLQISKKRAYNMGNILVLKYGIPKSRIRVTWKGSQFSGHKGTNRVVVLQVR